MPTGSPPSTIDYDQFVDARIKQTRAAVKITDLASGIATLLAAGLAFLLVAALVEHWVVPGGYSVGERAGLLGVVLVGGVIYSARRLLPVIAGRVNPVYAAREIERDAPELKNSLVNLLQLRSSGATSQVIQQTLEQQAAERLATASEATIDRGGLLRVGYVLLGLVAVMGIYVVLSPKDLFATAGRIALPWADIAAPTRVQIMDITPGAATVSQGDTMEVSARLSGLQEDDIVELVYSARDGRTIDRRLTMQTDASGIRYRSVLGAAAGSTLGLQTSLQYRLVAGDARSPLYRVQVLSSPTIAPQKVTYDYPDYTGYADRTVEGVGDLEAIEGTRVKLTAEANLPIESAQIDLDADGTPDIRLRADGQTAVANFTLRRDGERAGGPRESVYVIRFTSAEGQSNTNPARHRLVVTPDLVPEAAILQPEEATVDVALGDEIEIEIEARDPDFALDSVRLLGEVKGRGVLNDSLLSRSKKGYKGKFFVRRTLSPEQLRLSAGDVLTYWIEATDTRSPEANRVVTARKRLRVVASDPQKGKAGDQQNNQQGEASDETNDKTSDDSTQQQGENNQAENGEPSASAAGDGQQQEGQQLENQQTQQDEQQPSDEADPSGGSQGEPPPGGIQGEGKENQNSESDEEGQGGAASESSSDDKKQGKGDAGDSAGTGEPNSESSGSEGQTGERRSGKPTGGAQQPVADDGSDDGAAFDRIQKHLADKDSEQNGSDKNSEQGDPSEAPSSGDAASKEGDPSQGETGDPHAGSEDSTDQSRDAPADSPERSVEGEAPEGSTGQEGQQSDSQSSESGESGGEESSSQEPTTPHDGTGSTGQSQAADEGTGQSGDEGAGDQSGQSGDEQTAGEETGQSSGDQPGEGSQTSDSPSASGGETGDSSGEMTGGEPTGEGEASDAPAADAEGSPSSPNGSDGQGQESDEQRDPEDKPTQGDDVRGGERDPAAQLPDSAEPLSEPGGDEANLDYARKQTDLVLKRLSEQLDENKVDNKLLEKLGWSKEDLRRFVSRWQDRQQRAATGDAQGKSELDSALRSLGLSKNGPTTTGTLEKDQLRDLRQRTRTTIPPALRDRLRPYNRGISASRDE